MHAARARSGTPGPGLGPPARVANLHGYALPRNQAVVVWGLGLIDALLEPDPPDPRGDLVLHAAWRGAEALLRRRRPTAVWALTPSINRDYPAAWTAFLHDHGYRPRTGATRERPLRATDAPTDGVIDR